MVDVGTVTVGVEVSGEGLGEELAAEIRKAVEPAIREVNAQLRTMNRDIHDIDTNKFTELARKAGASVNAIKEAERQVRGLNRTVRDLDTAKFQTLTERARRAAAAVTLTGTNATKAGVLITASVDKAIRDYERLGTAADKSAARQIAAAGAVATAIETANRRIDASNRRVVPPGSGPGRGARGTGGYGNHYHGYGLRAAGTLGSPLGVNAVALGVGAIPALATGATNLMATLEQLMDIGLVMPGIMASMAASLGTAKVGFSGMADAVKDLGAAMKSNDPKDWEKANADLKDMAPNAQSLAKALVALAPQFKGIKQMVQQNMLAGMDKAVTDMTTRTVPTLKTGLDKVSAAWNVTLKSLTAAVGAPSTQGLLSRIFGDTARAQRTSAAAIEPFVHAMGTLAAAGSDTIPRLSRAVVDLTNRFDRFITTADNTGQLSKWINNSETAFRHLGDSVLNIGKIIHDLDTAAGGGFLGRLDEETAKLHAFLTSMHGQNDLTMFFAEGRDMIKAWEPILQDLATKVLPEVIEACRQWSEIMLPFLHGATSLLGAMPTLVKEIIVSFLAFRTVTSVIRGLSSAVGGLGGALGKSGGAAGSGGGGGGGSVLAGGGKGLNRALLGGGLLVGGITAQSTIGQENTLGQALGAGETIGGTALLGAGIGSLFPGPGTAIGAGVGAGVGAVIAGLNYLYADNATKAKAAAVAQEEWSRALATGRAAAEQTAQAVQDLNDDLVTSKGTFDPSSLRAVSDMISALPDKLAGGLNPDQIKAVAESMKSLGMTTEQMSTIVTGAQSDFDALVTRLNNLGTGGATAAQQLLNIRTSVLAAADNAKTAAPLLDTLAKAMGTDIVQAAVNLKNSLDAIPRNTPVNVNMPGGKGVLDLLQAIHAKLATDLDGTIHVTAPLADDVLNQLKALGYQIQQNKDGTIDVELDPTQYADTLAKLGTLGDVLKTTLGQLPNMPAIVAPSTPQGPFGLPYVLAPPPGTPPGGGPPPSAPPIPSGPGSFGLPFLFGPGSAAGGVTPGYTPGRDTMMWPMSGGEGVLIPEVMAQPGARSWLYGINSLFRSGLPRSAYGLAGGGIAGFKGGGVNLGTPGDPNDPVIALLTQIRDLLAGRVGGPINTTGDATQRIADEMKNVGGVPGASPGMVPTGQLGPFGTPIMKPAGNMAYNIAAAELKAFGLNPEAIIGVNPLNYFPQTGAGGIGINAHTMLGATGGPDVHTLGLPPAAFGGSGAPGGGWPALGAPNAAGGGWSGNGGIAPAAFGGAPGSSGLKAALQVAQGASGGAYQWGGVGPLYDCSGFISTIYAALTGKPYGSGERYLTTASDFTQLGFQPGADPRSALNVSVVQGGPGGGHIAGTLAGIPIESGGMTGEGATFGGAARGSLPGGTPYHLPLGFDPSQAFGAMPAGFGGFGIRPAGFGGAGTGAGGASPVYVTNWPGQSVTPPPAGTPPAVNQTPPGTGPGGVPAGPFGTPVSPGQTGVPEAVSATLNKVLTGPLLQAGGQVFNKVSGDVLNAVAGGTSGVRNILTPAVAAAPAASFSQLFKQGSPLAAAAAIGIPIPNMAQAGPTTLQSVMAKMGPEFNAEGQIFSNTEPISQRTSTDITGSIDALKAESVAATHEVQKQLTSQVLIPMLSTGVTTGMDQLSNAVLANWGDAMGGAAAQPIATAVANATAQAAAQLSAGAPILGASTYPGTASAQTSSQAIVAAPVQAATAVLDSAVMDTGGIMPHGTAAFNLSGLPERVLNPTQTQLFDAGRLGGWNMPRHPVTGLPALGVLPSGMPIWPIGGAAGGGTTGEGTSEPGISNANLTIGAQYLGLSQIPILGEIVNILVNVLLSVLGINVQVADTLNDVSTNFKQFRGAFQEFNAIGQLFNDTSMLADRSQTSTSEVAAQRLAILEQVITGLIQYIINNVIVPLIKAVADAAVQAGGAAAGTAISAGISGASEGDAGPAGGIAGSAASSFIDALGTAGVNIGAQIGQAIADALVGALVPALGSIFSSYFPGIDTAALGGGGGGGVLGRAGGILGTVLGGGLGLLSTIIAAILSIVPTGGAGLFGNLGALFDDGGMATGMGLMPKAVIQPERVLSPRQTSAFERMVTALENGVAFGNSTTTVHAPFTVTGGQAGAQVVQNRLLALMS